ncbi:MAG: murein biosynthesis integral membrane protein MurJ [Burkholderiales bacterium]|jgi:putative peptidoglycan lipid II flippase
MNLLRAASVVSLLTLLSRMTGLVREQIIAATFGASALTDAFNVAFRIPNLLRRLFAEGAFSQAFVPLLGQVRALHGDEESRALINAVATILTWVILMVSVLGVIAAPLLVWAMASGLPRFDEAVIMTRWMFPYIACMSLVALAAGVLNTWKQFSIPAATPVLLNLSVIGAAWLLPPLFKAQGIQAIYALAVGVMLGGVLQLGVQIPALKRVGCCPRIGFRWRSIQRSWHHPGVHKVLKQMGPAVLGVSVAQLSLLINTQIASHLGVGAVSWITYADRLMEFPTAMLGVALGAVLLPQLTAAQSKGDQDGYSGALDWGLRLVVMLALPCAAALLVFPQALVAVLYHYGAFSAHDLKQTVHATMGYGVGLLGLVSIKILAPGFYAQQDLKTPVKIGIMVLLLTQLMNFFLVPHFGHGGLTLSISLGATLNALWLLAGLRRSGNYQPAAGWPIFLLKVLFATGMMTAFLWGANQTFDWSQAGRTLWRLAEVGGCMLLAAFVYLSVLFALGFRLQNFYRRG